MTVEFGAERVQRSICYRLHMPGGCKAVCTVQNSTKIRAQSRGEACEYNSPRSDCLFPECCKHAAFNVLYAMAADIALKHRETYE